MAPPPPPSPLMEELEEEVLLRFPQHEPALLVRAALVCKRWRRLVTGPGFQRRFRELHRTPPMLGFFCNCSNNFYEARFVPTAAALYVPDAGLGHRRVLDARHGRVLQRCLGVSRDALVVWDPITDEQLEFAIPTRFAYKWTAAVVCAAAGPCEHIDCHRGPFLVVFVGSGYGETFICTYSSDAGTWTEPIIREENYAHADYVDRMRSVLVGNALYFGLLVSKVLLKYDLESHQISVIGMPPTYPSWCHLVLAGGLGIATLHGSKLCIWMKSAPEEVDARWTQNRVIELPTLLPVDDAVATPYVVGYTDAEGIGIVFVRANYGLFTIDLKTCKVKKVCEGRNISSVVPYMSFYTPALGAACTSGGSSMGTSGATTED